VMKNVAQSSAASMTMVHLCRGKSETIREKIEQEKKE
jgi:hypothetical protein